MDVAKPKDYSGLRFLYLFDVPLTIILFVLSIFLWLKLCQTEFGQIAREIKSFSRIMKGEIKNVFAKLWKKQHGQ
ncbi:hypothetical protein [Aquicella lusitana]|uniref:Uncharacterized protein n=1 Tax=Aquicella lusitana TaxID=254246 RepID=A0A370G8W7_9COXI|nr:hypothetical protein [Aquicella lusitana]RDI38944.1 hypothetical protein C8D86_1303 [Aquicella lusitana]VVC74307.1 hypothetical protein AQULUS_20720 [Aquicella lusitana]